MRLSKESLYLVLDSLVDTLSDIRAKLFYKIIIETSCKTSEISGIKLKDISQNKIKFAKRSVSISNTLSELIREYISEQNLSPKDYLFLTRQSEKISPKRIRQIIHNSSKEKTGYKIDPKDLREYSIKNKLKIKDVQEVKKEAGLKRLDKRKYLSNEQIKKLTENISDKRTSLIFQLLLNNLKSSQIVDLKVEDILSLNLPKKLIEELENQAFSNKVSFGEYLFKTRQGTHLSKVMIFKIIKNIGKQIGIEVNPQVLNNTAIANAVFSKDSGSKLNDLGIKTSSFHLHGGFIKNE
jgi:integrase